MTIESIAPMVSGLWTTVAILAGGYARTRNRSALTWFVLTLFLGPIAAFMLVYWPALEDKPSPPSVAERVRDEAGEHHSST